MVRFDGVHAFGYNSAGSEPIYMKFGLLWAHCLPLVLEYFGRDPRRSDSERARQRFFVFLSGKQRTTLPISGWPNFTKFTRKTWIGEVVNPFWLDIILKISPQGVVFQKSKFWPKSSTICDFRTPLLRNVRLQINENSPPNGPSTGCSFSIFTVGISSKSFPWTADSVRGRRPSKPLTNPVYNADMISHY